ncbi:photosystem I chlorophyll a/b-binding protein 6, chloroplastic [Tanacetum coccineum]
MCVCVPCNIERKEGENYGKLGRIRHESTSVGGKRKFNSRYLLRSSSNGLKVKAAKKGVSSVCEPLPADRPVWFPGKSPPEWLDGSLPGDFGFDPLGLAMAMLAVAGILIPEWLESLGFVDNFSWFDAGSREYFADSTTLKRPKPDVGYPGGLWFDPFMWGRGSPEPVMVLRTKEIKNGRLSTMDALKLSFRICLFLLYLAYGIHAAHHNKMSLTTSEIIAKLNLIPNSEGGFFILEIDDKNGSVKFTNMGQDILSNQVLQYTVRPDVWFGAFPSRDFDVVMENKLVKKAPRDARKLQRLFFGRNDGCTCI